MISYETCPACHAREIWDLGSCNRCIVTKSAKTQKEKSASVQEEIPYFVRLMDYYGH